MKSELVKVTRRPALQTKGKDETLLLPIVDPEDLAQVHGGGIGEDVKPGDTKRLWALAANVYSAKSPLEKKATATESVASPAKKQGARKPVARTTAQTSPKQGSGKSAP